MKLSLGIDTSNYKTSVGVVDEEGNIIIDLRSFLDVPKGSRGLRQQEAFFQHVNKLPNMIREAFSVIDVNDLDVISVSNKPRPTEDSYMPCFMAGVNIGNLIATSMGLPIKQYSHQEGHIRAGLKDVDPINKEEFISFHFSGGTTEALLCKMNEDSTIDIDIIGGSKDISFGQLIDRVGVKLGMDFPAGEELDALAMHYSIDHNIVDSKLNDILPRIKVSEPFINLSGIETAFVKAIDERSINKGDDETAELSLVLMNRIQSAIYDMIEKISLDLDKSKIKDCVLVGGVSSSRYIRKQLPETISGLKIHFAKEELSSDNAVGIALLGGDAQWR